MYPLIYRLNLQISVARPIFLLPFVTKEEREKFSNISYTIIPLVSFHLISFNLVNLSINNAWYHRFARCMCDKVVSRMKEFPLGIVGEIREKLVENDTSRFRNAAVWKMHIACERHPHATRGWKSRVHKGATQLFVLLKQRCCWNRTWPRTACTLLHENVPPPPCSALSHAFVSIVLWHGNRPNLFCIRHADRFTLLFDRSRY